MGWIEQWQRIAARIAGLNDAAIFLIQAFQVNNSDTYGSARFLSAELELIMNELAALDRSFADQLPPSAKTALQEHIYKQPNPTITSGHAAVYLQVLAQLFAFRSRFEYLIGDDEVEGRNATELSFEHLKRLIAVDANSRLAWKQAWIEGELSCERLGAVHLLNHGIWAFKAQAKGAATDLVYDDPLSSRSTILGRTARAIVLTEWKVVRRVTEVDRQAQIARDQTKLYASGVLGGLELKRTRYIILVGEKETPSPADLDDNGVTFRHIWISVDPATPSAQARRAANPKGSANVRR